MFASLSEERRIRLTLEGWDTVRLRSYLMRLQDKEPNSHLIPLIIELLAKRRLTMKPE